MLRGRVVADLDPATVTPADLGSYMTGVTNGGLLMFERIWRASLAPLAAAGAAIIISSIALLISGNDPIDAFKEMWQTIDSTESVVLIINRAVPYYIAGVAVAIGFKMNLFNIGSNGQYILAALISGWAGAQVSLPAPIHVAFVFLVAITVGGTWALIAAILNVTRNVNVVISTIMLNYIAIGLVAFLLSEFLADDESAGLVAQTKPMPSSAQIPPLNKLIELVGFNFAAGVVLYGFLPFAILLGVAYHVLLNRSRFGYDLKVSGLNPDAARSAGVNPKKMVLITLFMSGAVAGMIGLPFLLADPNFQKYGDAFPVTIGFTGLGLALLGRNSPIGIAAAAIVWATIERATQRLGPIGIPQEIGRILQGSFLLVAVIAYEVIRRRNDAAVARAAAAATARIHPDEPPPPAPFRWRERRHDHHHRLHHRRRGRTRRQTVVAHHPLVAGRAGRSVRWPSCRSTRILADNDDLTSSGTFGVALRVAAPIGLAGLSGLVAERSGTINIGLDGMMVLGTIFAGWWGWQYGPWMALLGGIVGGMIGGLVMSVATTTFGVNHIVAGVAINIIAPGSARFMAGELFADVQGGSITTSPGNKGAIGAFTVPFLSGGDLFGWTTPDTLGWLEDRSWFLIADVGGHRQGAHHRRVVGRGADDRGLLRHRLPAVAHPAGAPAPVRRRATGCRRLARRVGPQDAIHRHGAVRRARRDGRSGARAVRQPVSGEPGRRSRVPRSGHDDLRQLDAAGNRPRCRLFGYAQGITLRTNPADLVNALILAAGISLLVLSIWMIFERRWQAMGFMSVFTAITFWAFFAASEPNNQLVFVTPYVVTLIAVSVGAQRLRPPAEEGIPWFKGMQ